MKRDKKVRSNANHVMERYFCQGKPILVAVSVMLCVFWRMPTSADSGTSRDSVDSVERQLRVGPTSTPPVIDGDLTEQCWRDAAMASGFITIEGEWAWEQTTGYINHDDAHLYIAFSCNARAADKIKADATKHDDVSVCNDDSVEIYLDTNHDRTTYYHFIINSIGTRYDASVIKLEEHVSKVDWNPEVELKTRTLGRSWTVEMRIPFASLATRSPRAGDVWGMNLNRTRTPHHEAMTNTPHSSWAKVPSSFHRPRYFGQLVFGSSPGVSCSLSGMTGHELSLKLRNGSESSQVVQAKWTGSGTSTGARPQVSVARLGPGEEKEIRMMYDAHKWRLGEAIGPRAVEMELEISNPQSAEIYESTEALFRFESPFFSYFSMSMDRYYYTPEIRRLQVILAPRIQSGARFKVEISKAVGGAVLAGTQIPLAGDQGEHAVSFDIADWDLGRYVMAVELQNEDGKALHSMHRVFFRKNIDPAKLPSPTPEISIRSDGIILVDAEPFCPFFVGGVKSPSPLCRDCFNVNFGGFGTVVRPLERREVGLPSWTRVPGDLFRLLPEEDELREHIREVVTASKADPLLLYWFRSYEAQIPMYRGKRTGVRLDNAEQLRNTSRFVKSVDPNHLTALHIDRGPWERYKNSADIMEVACPDSSSYSQQLIPQIIEDVEEVRKALDGMPFLYWIGASLPHARTAEEIRCASYLALMHGAAGIVFHLGHEGVDHSFTRHWSVYRGLSREIEELFAILTTLQPTNQPRIDVQPAGVIDFRVREYKDKMYLIAVNTSDSLVNARISIGDDATVVKQMELPFENRTIRIEGNSFADMFTFFEPHVYEFVPEKKIK